MALTRYPADVAVTATAEATATATSSALSTGDIGSLLVNILVELKIITTFLQQGLDVRDDPNVYRANPDQHL